MLGRPIVSVDVLHPRPVRRHLAGPVDFAARLAGRTFTAVHRRGKYLWLSLDNGDALLGHLGMSGQMLVQPPGVPDETHLRVRFLLGVPDSPEQSAPRHADREGPNARDYPELELRFVDQRTFGGLAVSEGGADCRRRSRTSPATRSTRSSTTTRSSAASAAASQASSGSCSTRASSRASGTSTPTRGCGGPGCTGNASGRACGAPTCAECSPDVAT